MCRLPGNPPARQFPNGARPSRPVLAGRGVRAARLPTMMKVGRAAIVHPGGGDLGGPSGGRGRGMPAREGFQVQLDRMEQGIVGLAVQVEGVIAAAVAALASLDAAAGREIAAGDRAIDDREAELERDCLRLLARQQPVAGDLRAIGAALRILIDLERIADHATDIARTAVRLEGQVLLKPLVDIPRMAELAQDMVARAVDAYVRRDEAAARALVAVDDEVDHLFSRVFGDLIGLMGERPEAVHQGTHLLFAASHLERIADHATNLAEAVIYAVTGQRPELND